MNQSSEPAYPAPPKNLAQSRPPNETRSLPLLDGDLLVLAGCLQSEQPKLADAAAPLGEGGRYAVYEPGVHNRYQRQEAVVIKRRSDRAYDFVDERVRRRRSPSTCWRQPLRRAGGAGKDEPGYGYAVLRVAERSFGLRPAMRRSGQGRAGGGRGRGECPARILDKVGDAPALFKRLNLGEPVSKLVRE